MNPVVVGVTLVNYFSFINQEKREKKKKKKQQYPSIKYFAAHQSVKMHKSSKSAMITWSVETSPKRVFHSHFHRDQQYNFRFFFIA